MPSIFQKISQVLIGSAYTQRAPTPSDMRNFDSLDSGSGEENIPPATEVVNAMSLEKFSTNRGRER